MKTTLILGGQGVGKSTLAKQMTEGRKTAWISGEVNTIINIREYADEATECIVIDGTVKVSDFLKQLIKSDTITIRKPYTISPITITRPELIIISNFLTEKDFADVERHIQVTVNLGKFEDIFSVPEKFYDNRKLCHLVKQFYADSENLVVYKFWVRNGWHFCVMPLWEIQLKFKHELFTAWK